LVAWLLGGVGQAKGRSRSRAATGELYVGDFSEVKVPYSERPPGLFLLGGLVRNAVSAATGHGSDASRGQARLISV
jgi:hypothetical protein